MPDEHLQSITSYPETLEVTESRQFREKGLVHISDACFLVSVHLEQLRVDFMNSTKLQQHKQDLVNNAYEVKACFSSKDVLEKKAGRIFYRDSLYIKFFSELFFMKKCINLI